MAYDPFHILRCAHAELHVTNLERSRAFYDMLGFVVTEETPNQLFLRGVEERVHHSLVLTQADVPTVAHLSFRVESDDDLENLYEFYVKRGCRPRWREAGEERGQGRALLVQDPFGFPVEYFAQMEQVQSYHQLYHLHRGGAVRRIDHFNCFMPDFDNAFTFWTKEMGFVLTEYVESDDEPREMSAAWLHKKPSVHDLAMMKGDGPRVHHVGFWMEDMTSIIRVCDILGGAALHEHIERGPGRHGISNAFFLYLRDPDGHRIELYTSDYLTIDPDMEPIRWSSTDPRRQTLWGHKTPDSWWQEASAVLDLETGRPFDQQAAGGVERLKDFIK
ncbi:3,4-dihydroxyphenylacetate 2,3-dioxygenase [Alicyclobacillus cycloheptanicus]|uniref:3,4-dihydroxyphenylacetate 2,3-dioxygenase n=1 Tax=Alicyclobacillus cycloheptanicus TaxID=1457 RepID=A0ABT9XH55_9BACL|nr:3,4-dihydroxyphenylacetate 2,3-dioxygenase [Alicyclobacillus cycloheptanicus]MDQ0189138.1 3,4-dihydroxyphenylacetate 2,3-dioxygenase [Alicyclobacillus cycloheptanicus]WDM00264.1 3,4-dihydroxyphenylacetate 2,3-dioxygenase [Alicyclobacillus cycloheptanicus]